MAWAICGMRPCGVPLGRCWHGCLRRGIGGVCHGIEAHLCELTPYTAAENYEATEAYSLGLPEFPMAGSIVDMGDYIIVHF